MPPSTGDSISVYNITFTKVNSLPKWRSLRKLTLVKQRSILQVQDIDKFLTNLQQVSSSKFSQLSLVEELKWHANHKIIAIEPEDKIEDLQKKYGSRLLIKQRLQEY